MPASYRETLEFLRSFIDYSVERGVNYTPQSFDSSRVATLLSLMDNPHQRFGSVHIAGTKGKGSTAAMTESILRAAGHRTGLFTSPHLHTLREYFRVAGEIASEEELIRLVQEAQPLIARVPGITYVEILVALAFQHFARKGVEIAVVEVLMGGRLDATNVLQPLVAAITSLSYDHIALLGDTLAAIAGEKAGIIKRGAPVVSAPQKRQALEVIQQVSEAMEAPLILLGRDWVWQAGQASLEGQEFDVTDQRAGQTLSGLWTPLLGKHQLINATVAVAIVAELRWQGVAIGEEALRAGLRQVQWPGRLEILSRRPLVVVDGAHNVDSAGWLADSLRELFSWRRSHLIFGASADKDIDGMLELLLPLADQAHVVRSRHPRAAPAETLRAAVERRGRRAALHESVKQALVACRGSAGPSDLIWATGSLFVVAEAREAWAEITGAEPPAKDPI